MVINSGIISYTLALHITVKDLILGGQGFRLGTRYDEQAIKIFGLYFYFRVMKHQQYTTFSVVI